MKQCIKRGGIFLVCIWLLAQSVSAAQTLIPGGEVIGIELSDGSVTVAAFDEELGRDTQAAGLQVGDRISHIDEIPVASVKDVRYALARSDGTVDVTVERKGKTEKIQVSPQITPEGPKLGLYLKQGTTGVGTVTWYDPATGNFGALGHGVNDPDGALLAMEQGKVYRATVMSVKKGEIGDPGQLMGKLAGQTPIGVLTANTSRGIFGKAAIGWKGESLPVGNAKDAHKGAAVIRSTVHDGRVQEYSVEILKIYPNAGEAGRNLLLKVTDPALLSATGGIVQGMGVSYNKDNQWNP